MIDGHACYLLLLLFVPGLNFNPAVLLDQAGIRCDSSTVWDTLASS